MNNATARSPGFILKELDRHEGKNYQKLVDSRAGLLKGKSMKTKFISAVLVIAMCMLCATPASATDDLDMVGDVLVVRPACFVATIVGSVLFVIALPAAAMSGSIKKSAQTFVVKPARATFTRPLGNLEELEH